MPHFLFWIGPALRVNTRDLTGRSAMLWDREMLAGLQLPEIRAEITAEAAVDFGDKEDWTRLSPPPLSTSTREVSKFWRRRFLSLRGAVPGSLLKLAWALVEPRNIGSDRQGQIRPEFSLGAWDILYTLDPSGRGRYARFIAGVNDPEIVSQDWFDPRAQAEGRLPGYSWADFDEDSALLDGVSFVA